MNIETYLDYNQLLKVVFEVLDDEVKYDFVQEDDENHLTGSIIDNLKKISRIEETGNPEICMLSINNTIFISVNKKTGEIENVNKLTAFETRMLAQGKKESVPFERSEDNDFLPKTDLHTHFAGAITVDSLIEVGKKHNILYDGYLLESIGIDISRYEVDEKGKIRFNDIDEKDIEILKKSLKISPITQETFNRMEEIYALRGPFTKNKECFPDFLRVLAEDYQKTGVEYAELSFSAFLNDPEYMQMLEDNLPQIEEETGVKLRFLAGFWRHSDIEWNLDDADRLMSIAKSPYIVGCDFMGHEINSTLDFKDVLKALTRYAVTEDPEFVIRVHAGENPIFKTNVYDALKTISDEHEAVQNEQGRAMQMPQVRIGHGLYGLDIQEDGNWNALEEGAVLKLAKKMGAIVEFNMSSNLALNNINDISEVPIKRYLDAGIDVVLGTDGHGMYSTFNGQETVLAIAAGVTVADLDKMKETESKVISRALAREAKHPTIEDVDALYAGIRYSTPDGEKRYTPELEKQYKQKRLSDEKELIEKIKNETGSITDPEQIEADIEGKTPIMISGASKNAWENVHPNDKKKIALTMQVLADVLNPETSYIITGGTNFGVEKTMHEAVNDRNKREDKKMVLLGTFTMEALQDKDIGIAPDTITHGMIIEINGRKANNWKDLPDTQLIHTQERGGSVIAIAGGSIVSDMIQRTHNLKMDMHLMDGPNGASTDKSKSLRGNDYSFVDVGELLTRLYSRNPEIFMDGFSLDRIDEYVSQARREIDSREGANLEQGNSVYSNFGIGAMENIDATITAKERETGMSTLQKEQQELEKGEEEVGDDTRI